MKINCPLYPQCKEHFKKFKQRICFDPLYSLADGCELVKVKYGFHKVSQEEEE